MTYSDIFKHYEKCYEEYGDNNKGVDWPNNADAQKRYKIMLEITQFDTSNRIDNQNTSILDFGCGLGHLYEYIIKNNMGYKYYGADISDVFVEACRKKFPNIPFVKTDILKEKNVLGEYDYIIANGVFTEKRSVSYDNMFSYFSEMIAALYSKARRGIAFNLMSKDVDWEREDLFHVSLNDLSHFLTKEITRDFIIRYDYGLYEYTTYLYKRK